MQNLENFESTKSALRERLDWINREVEKPAAAGSQDAVRKDIKSQQELLEELDELKTEMTRLTALKVTTYVSSVKVQLINGK